MSPQDARHWYDVFLPWAEKGGPLLTLLLALMFALTLWYGLAALRDCVNRNRALAERMLAQQETFHRDLLLALAHCEGKP